MKTIRMMFSRLPMGTRSVLFGAHCFLTHWMFVVRGWHTLYGFRRVKIGTREEHVAPTVTRHIFTSLWDFRLWVAFFVHDLGYWGKPNMDGDEGERHPEWACSLMYKCFGHPWGEFVLTHSRFYAKKLEMRVSPLCYADKLAICFEPYWFYLPRVRFTGEIQEYMKGATNREASKGWVADVSSEIAWYTGVQDYMRKWVNEHKDGREDTWTATALTKEQKDSLKLPEEKRNRLLNGVWE